MLAFIAKVIIIPVVAVLGKINVHLVFTLVTKATNVHVLPSVRPSVRNFLTPTRPMFVKFYIGGGGY